jgi:hypothetical protein
MFALLLFKDHGRYTRVSDLIHDCVPRSETILPSAIIPRFYLCGKFRLEAITQMHLRLPDNRPQPPERVTAARCDVRQARRRRGSMRTTQTLPRSTPESVPRCSDGIWSLIGALSFLQSLFTVCACFPAQSFVEQRHLGARTVRQFNIFAEALAVGRTDQDG